MGQEGIPAFGTLLRRLRRAAGLTQEALAERSGLSARGVSDLERGLRTTPRQDTLDLLIEALDPDPDDRARLVASARRRVDHGDAQAAGNASGTGLPTPLTPLIGRNATIATSTSSKYEPPFR